MGHFSLEESFAGFPDAKWNLISNLNKADGTATKDLSGFFSTQPFTAAKASARVT